MIVFSLTGGAKGKCLFLCTSTGNVFVYHVSVELEEAKSFWLQGWIFFFNYFFLLRHRERGGLFFCGRG